ncbi:MAG: hypothetical protein K2Q15_03080, partial [Burkholderiales bacterium]|nr:hypothetical protein [Burkholderiales bacterium]
AVVRLSPYLQLAARSGERLLLQINKSVAHLRGHAVAKSDFREKRARLAADFGDQVHAQVDYPTLSGWLWFAIFAEFDGAYDLSRVEGKVSSGQQRIHHLMNRPI